MKNKLLYFLLSLWALTANSQTIFYDQLDLKSGLPSSVVYDIFQDSKGFIWIATDEGLLKYNGYNFKTYSHPDLHAKSGSNIKEDVLGRIWYQTFDGFLFFVDNKDQMQTFTQKNNIGFVNFVITKEYLIKTTWDGIEVRNIKTLKIKKEIKIPKIQTSFLEVSENKIILGNTETKVISLENWKSEKIKNEPLKKATKLLTYQYQNHLYFLTQESNSKCRLYKFSKNELIPIAKIDNTKNIQNFEIVDNTIWICTKKGAHAFTFTGRELSFTSKLPSEDISKVFKDYNNVYWFTSLSKGIFIIKNFNSWELQLANEKFNAITSDKNNLYVSSSSGKIYQLDSELNHKIYWKNEDLHPVYYLDFNTDSKYNFFSANGFYILQKTNKKVTHFNSAVKQIIPFKPNLFLTTGTGFVNSISTNPTIQWKDNILTNIRGKSIVYNSKNNRILTATNNGLFSIQNGENHELSYRNKPLFIKSLITENKRTIALSNQGELFEIKEKSIEKIKSNRLFTHLKKDLNETLLVDKNNVFRLEKNKIIKLFSVGKFLKIKDLISFNSNYFIITEDKIIRINKEKNNKNSFKKPNLFIENILVNGKIKSINKTKLDANENDIQINFNLLNFDFDSDYQLVYKINGALKNVTNFSTIKLVALAPENYFIEVGIQDKNTSKTEFIQTISFEILPPLWKRSWFILTSIFLLLCLIFIIYKWKIRQIKAKNEKAIEKLTLENNLKESRLQLIKSQMNPHFFFNAINNIQSYIFTNETKEASVYLTKFSKLTRKILEFSDVNSISLKDEIASLQLYLELQQMRFKDLKFEIKCNSTTNIDNIKIPTMLIQPYVENAILHGLSHSNKDKKLEIKFEGEFTNLLTVTIYDNGIGRIKSAELNQLNTSKPKSFATKANLERIMLLNKDQYQIDVNYEDLYDEFSESCGTKVTIKIKL
ncbi:Two-component system sensor histidine kinase [Flavobacterium indicum GPTSA100-9 = DSM 17447]|uniref:Two-component system sensor histidine kinase n=1 Tax=Flavobacterium indicum (strain DSM 17447 / CIP 109464 / GPTSA100-9) TaxID=1094466 RepID=H8XQ00_FLAIG|nr:histidine kinase [Flavobacterium indicum]CCG54216.1 Two-component system sensor histidine kinase [Flavobacterium indicum GPTSA100-9 = DSM 17447]